MNTTALLRDALGILVLATVATGCDDDTIPPTDPGPPTTILESVPPPLTNRSHTVFTFHAVRGGDDFVCTIDQEQRGCVSPFEIDLPDGAHRFAVAVLGDTTPAIHS